MDYVARIGDTLQEVEITEAENGEYLLKLGDQTYRVDLRQIGREPLYSMLVDGQSYQFYAELGPNSIDLLMEGERFTVGVRPRTAATISMAQIASDTEAGPLQIKSPMPGVINDVYVQPGQPVERGEHLLLLEAMKMNNEIRSPRAGVVQEVRVVKGQRVNKDEVLVTLT